MKQFFAMMASIRITLMNDEVEDLAQIIGITPWVDDKPFPDKPSSPTAIHCKVTIRCWTFDKRND